MRFQPMFNIWEVPQPLRRHIQPGQHVFAGDRASRGVFLGANGTTTVVAWQGNAKAHKRSTGGIRGYYKSLREYARSLR